MVFSKYSIIFLSSHTYYYTSSNLSLSFLPLYLPTTLPLYFLLLFYNLPLLLLILFLYKFDIIFSFNPYFSHTKCEFSLSLFLSEFLFFLITLIKVDGFFFFNMCFGIVFFFNIPSESLLFPFYSFGWILVWVNT